MTYSNAPDLPTEIGDQWTNPDTGVNYEWNGERWVIVGSANYDAQYVKRSGDTMTGPFILDGQPTVPRMASDKSYVDDEIDKVKEEIAILAIEKGTSRNYQVSSLTSLTVTDPGNLALNSSDPLLVTQIALSLTDVGGQETRIPLVGDIIEFDRISDGKTMKYVIDNVPNGNATYIEVGVRSGTLDAFAIGELYSTFLYPQQSDDVAHLNADQTFTGINTFENRTNFEANVTISSNDNSHRLYMRDEDGNTNFTIFPNGTCTSKSHIIFQPQKFSTFNERYSSYIRVDTPPGWSTSDGDFGFYVDISRGSTQQNRFVVGGRGGRQKAFEVYDDGQGRMRVYGKAQIDNDLKVVGELTVDDECNFREDVHVYGAQGLSTATLVAGKTYLIIQIDLNESNAFATWYSAGVLKLELGGVFKCIQNTTLPSGNRAAEVLTSPDLQVGNDIYCGGSLIANDVEGHTFVFDGHGDFKGDVIFEDVVTFDEKVTAEDIKVNGLLDLSTANISSNSALPKSYFTRILKEFNNEFRSIYINHGTNGTSDPPIEIKASSSAGNLIQCRNSSNSVRWGVNVHNGFMFGGTSSAPWLPTSDHHFAVKKYVDNQVTAVDNKIQTSSGPTGMWFKFGGDTTSLSIGRFILNGNRLIFDAYNDDGLLWLGGLTTESGEQSIWSHCSIYRQSGNTFILDRMYQLEKMRVGTSFSSRRSLNFTKIYLKYGSGLPSVGTRYLISCGGFF